MALQPVPDESGFTIRNMATPPNIKMAMRITQAQSGRVQLYASLPTLLRRLLFVRLLARFGIRFNRAFGELRARALRESAVRWMWSTSRRWYERGPVLDYYRLPIHELDGGRIPLKGFAVDENT